MSKRIVHTSLHAGELVSERTARRANAHARAVAVPAARQTPAPAMSAAVGDRRDPPRPTGDVQILRRWSVAALIASAPRPRAQSTGSARAAIMT